jgi:hypothetical protein
VQRNTNLPLLNPMIGWSVPILALHPTISNASWLTSWYFSQRTLFLFVPCIYPLAFLSGLFPLFFQLLHSSRIHCVSRCGRSICFFFLCCSIRSILLLFICKHSC